MMQPRDVYEIWTPDMSAVYVGISKCYKKRFYQHSRPRSRLHNIISAGAQVKCVASKIDEKLAARIERKLISRYRSHSTIECLNIADGGQMGSSGPRQAYKRHSDTELLKIRCERKWASASNKITSENYDDFLTIRRNKWLAEFSGRSEITVSLIRRGYAKCFNVGIETPQDDGEILDAVNTLRSFGIKVKGVERNRLMQEKRWRFRDWRTWKMCQDSEDKFQHMVDKPLIYETEWGARNQELEGWSRIEYLAKRNIRNKAILGNHREISRNKLTYFAKDAHKCGVELKECLKVLMSRIQIPLIDSMKRFEFLQSIFGDKWWVLEIAAEANPRCWQAPDYWADNLLYWLLGDEFEGEKTNGYGEEMLSDGIVACGNIIGDKELGVNYCGDFSSIFYYPKYKRHAAGGCLISSRIAPKYVTDRGWDSY